MIEIDANYHQRTMKKLASKSRRRCYCGCGQRATHGGCAGGYGMMTGCEIVVRRWVKKGKVE